jgi:hypothetical protein
MEFSGLILAFGQFHKDRTFHLLAKPLNPAMRSFGTGKRHPFLNPLVGVNRPGNRIIVHSLECHHEAAIPFWNRTGWKA